MNIFLVSRIVLIIVALLSISSALIGVKNTRSFTSLESMWTNEISIIQEQGEHLSIIRQNLGYGGFIHNFKNFVLRKDLKLDEQLISDQKSVLQAMAKYRSLGSSDRENFALTAIEAVFQNYSNNLPLVRQAALEGWSAEKTDQLARVDDGPAIEALETLNLIWFDQYNSQNLRLTKIIEISHRNTYVILVLACLSIVSIIGLFWSMRRIVHADNARDIAEGKLVLAEKVFDTMNEGAIVTDENNRIITVNPAFSKIKGYAPEDVIGKEPKLWQSGRRDKCFYENMWSRLGQDGTWCGEIWNNHTDGTVHPEYLSIAKISASDSEAEKYVAVFRDISHEKEYENKIVSLAMHDPLAGLANRNQFQQRLVEAAERAHRHGESVAVAMLDLDDFKLINDAFGHLVGDLSIQKVARLLSSETRQTDTVARIGGDEFALILTDVEDRKKIENLALRIIERLSGTHNIDGIKVAIKASLGIAFYPEDTDRVSELLGLADAALYEAKRSGKDTIHFFDPVLHQAIKERRRIEEELRRAITAGSFNIVYQPIVDLTTKEVQSLEALVRWTHPRLGNIPPSTFIPIAESAGLMSDVGDVIIKKIIPDIREWHDELHRPITVYINLSLSQLSSPNFAKHWLEMCDENGLPPTAIGVEITEAVLSVQREQTIAHLRDLRAAGVRVAIDDFGTGYSSLARIRQLPFDRLKIDGSFILDVATDERSRDLVRIIKTIGDNFSVDVVAERVEEAAQQQALRDIGINLGQGYYYSKPVSMDALVDLYAFKKVSAVH